MDEKILTIIVPSYNTFQYIDECLPSFCDDKLKKFISVLLIDDGANEITISKLKEYCIKYPDIFKYVHKSNGGHGSVINLGIHQYTDTKYVKVIDGDDWVETDNLYQLCLYLKNCNDDLVLSDYIECKCGIKKKISVRTLTKNKENNLSNFIINLPSITYKSSIFLDNNIKVRENIFYDDLEYDYFPLMYVNTFSYFPGAIYVYRLGNVTQSVSASSRYKHYGDICLVRDDLIEYYEDSLNRNCRELIPILIRSLACFFFNDYIYALNLKKAGYLRLVKKMRIRDKKFPEIRKYMLKNNRKYRLMTILGFKPFFLLKKMLNGRFS